MRRWTAKPRIQRGQLAELTWRERSELSAENDWPSEYIRAAAIVRRAEIGNAGRPSTWAEREPELGAQRTAGQFGGALVRWDS